MMLVLDASALTGWLILDEADADLISLAARHDVFSAPVPLWAKIRSILIVAERWGRISWEHVDQAIEMIDELGIVLDTYPSSAAVLVLFRRHGIAANDALDLDLALCENAELATLDAAMTCASRAEGAHVA